MPLTDKACKLAIPKDKDYKLSDEKGMFLLVAKTGGKYWRYKYRFAGKEKLLALGVYPEISLKEAREKRLTARKQLTEGLNPSELRKQEKLVLVTTASNTFESIALEWFANSEENWAPTHVKKQRLLLKNNLIPYLGSSPISTITPPILLACLKKIEARGAVETARRVKQISGQIFRYAVAAGIIDRDPSADLGGALKTPKAKHFPAITEPSELGALLRAIDTYQGTMPVAIALRLAPLFFVRPGELRHMEWIEVDFIQKEWRIPASKMKMGQPHIVPLCKKAISLLKELQALTGSGRYVFPSERTASRPMSENSLNAALRRLGYSKEEVTAHGFRATARTLLDEVLEFPPHLIEHQLAHEVKDAQRRAYNRTAHLPQRKKMMEAWAIYLEGLASIAPSEAMPLAQ